MVYKLLVMLHLLGASVWLGGHAVLMAVVLPAAVRRRDPGAIHDFERGYGRLGLAALVVQLATGLLLANAWLGGAWRGLLAQPHQPAEQLILAKLTLLALILGLAGHAYHRVLPRMHADNMRPFVVHATVVTTLSVLLLVVGVGIRTGGLFPTAG